MNTSTVSNTSLGNVLVLDQDHYINGTITDSCVSQDDGAGRYFVSIKPAYNGWQTSLAMWLEAHLGPSAANADAEVSKALGLQDLTFDSIIKPMVSGADEDGEFKRGQQVRLRVRIELHYLQTVDRGDIHVPRFQLSCVDALEGVAATQTPSSRGADVDPIYHDF